MIATDRLLHRSSLFYKPPSRTRPRTTLLFPRQWVRFALGVKGTRWIVTGPFVRWNPQVEWIPVGGVPGEPGAEVKVTIDFPQDRETNVYRYTVPHRCWDSSLPLLLGFRSQYSPLNLSNLTVS